MSTSTCCFSTLFQTINRCSYLRAHLTLEDDSGGVHSYQAIDYSNALEIVMDLLHTEESPKVPLSNTGSCLTLDGGEIGLRSEGYKFKLHIQEPRHFFRYLSDLAHLSGSQLSYRTSYFRLESPTLRERHWTPLHSNQLPSTITQCRVFVKAERN